MSSSLSGSSSGSTVIGRVTAFRSRSGGAVNHLDPFHMRRASRSSFNCSTRGGPDFGQFTGADSQRSRNIDYTLRATHIRIGRAGGFDHALAGPVVAIPAAIFLLRGAQFPPGQARSRQSCGFLAPRHRQHLLDLHRLGHGSRDESLHARGAAPEGDAPASGVV